VPSWLQHSPVFNAPSGRLILIGSFFLLSTCNAAPRSAGDTELAFVGGDARINCHALEYADWQGSDHDLAMRHAQPSTVLGDLDSASFTSFNTETRFFLRATVTTSSAPREQTVSWPNWLYWVFARRIQALPDRNFRDLMSA
jgi:hypothetical protein